MNNKIYNQNIPFAGATLLNGDVDRPLADGFFIMENQQEIWKDVVGYEGLYQVSNLGNVKSFISKKSTKDKWTKSERIIKPSICKFGYLRVVLCKDNIAKNVFVHRLVANAFLKDKNETVNHINGVKSDNRLCNLEWVSRSENQKHAYSIGLQKQTLKYNHPLRKPLRATKDNETIDFISVRDAARNLGVDSSDLRKWIMNGKIIKGYKIEFV